MKQLIEFIPIDLFGGVYFWTRDIFIATMVLMGGIVLQLAVEYWTTKKVSRQTQIIFWSAILLGGATLLFRNEEFLFWKPTIVNWIFSVTLLGFISSAVKTCSKGCSDPKSSFRMWPGNIYRWAGLPGSSWRVC